MRSRAQMLPPGWVAQPELGGERNGTKWELNRVYDATGRLQRDRTYWEIREVLADDPPLPRAVEFAEVGPGVSFTEFTRLTTPLAAVERWLARRREPAVEAKRARESAAAQRGALRSRSSW